MSATLVAKGLAAGHADRVLFSDLELIVAPGDVVGLVGANGAGKSTLLRLLAGLDEPEAGAVTYAPPDATIGYLPQEPDRVPGESVHAFLLRRTGVAEAEHAMNAAADALSRHETGADDAYGHALERWLALGGADIEERVGQVSADLRLDVDLDLPMTALSGGQAARAGLAALLLSRYDVFLLDEPTNDLDLEGLDILERFVSGLRSGVVLVSHDREFLTRTVTQVVEIDRAQQEVKVYGGGYESYLAERERARRHTREAYEEYADTRGSLEARARTQRAWMEKGVRNARRKATDNDKIGRNFRTETTEKQAAKARQTERLIERTEAVDEPRKAGQLRRETAAGPPAGAGAANPRAAASRARSGSCGWRPPRRRGPARSWRRCAMRWCGAGRSRSGRSTCRSTGPTGSPLPERTGPGSRRCSPRCWGGSRSSAARRASG